MNVTVNSDSPDFLICSITAIYESLTGIKLQNKLVQIATLHNQNKILCDTRKIVGYDPDCTIRHGVDLKPNYSFKIAMLESSNQIGKELFGEKEMKAMGIDVMVTNDMMEGINWLKDN